MRTEARREGLDSFIPGGVPKFGSFVSRYSDSDSIMSEAGPSAVKRENAALEDPEGLREEDLFRMLEESDFSDCDDVDIKESLLFKEESSSDEEGKNSWYFCCKK